MIAPDRTHGPLRDGLDNTEEVLPATVLQPVVVVDILDGRRSGVTGLIPILTGPLRLAASRADPPVCLVNATLMNLDRGRVGRFLGPGRVERSVRPLPIGLRHLGGP